MSSPVTVAVICEGFTEQTFIREVLAPSLWSRNIFLEYPLLGRPGHKGGNVEFKRALSDIGIFLKQRPDIFVSTMFDLYGMDSDWPGVSELHKGMAPSHKAELVEARTVASVKDNLPLLDIERRFIPYVAVHEFEALLFSDPAILASHLGVKPVTVERILQECREPEAINDNPNTAPCKRIEALTPGFRKTVKGRAIAVEIGVNTMREKCPHFNFWINRLEALAQ